MLSKKMAFSLISLVTIFAFCFIASPALAAKITFAVKDVDSTDIDSVDGDNADISAATGIQAEGQSIVTLTVTTDEVLAAVDIVADGGTTEDAFLFVQSAGTAIGIAIYLYSCRSADWHCAEWRRQDIHNNARCWSRDPGRFQYNNSVYLPTA